MKNLIIILALAITLLIPTQVMSAGDQIFLPGGGLQGVIQQIGSEHQSLTLNNGGRVVINGRVKVVTLDGKQQSVNKLAIGDLIEAQGEIDDKDLIASKIIVLSGIK